MWRNVLDIPSPVVYPWKHLTSAGFGGANNASGAIVDVGKTAGQLFGLLQDNYERTDLYLEYFEIKDDLQCGMPLSC
jgi:hypothetical protein